MSEKKLSFGFKNKIVKKINVISTKPTESQIPVQLIDYLEDQTINIKGAIIQEKKPLIIPIQSNDKNLIERVLAAKKLKERSNKPADEILNNLPDSELSLDELAARQLIREAKSNLSATSSKNGSIRILVVPAVEDTLILEGSKEPTLDDYENVPVGDFGFAMLRGMGWSEKIGIGKGKMSVSVSIPEVRPKGMGLGAYKMIQEEVPKQIAVDKDGKELNLIKGAFAKVIAGKEKGFYCKVEGLDDEAGRVIVKMAIKGTILSLNEFMLYPVNQEEYSTSSRILNNSKYRDYQEKEATSSGQASSNNKSSTSSQEPHLTKIIKTEIKKMEHKGTKKGRSQHIIKEETIDKEKKSRRSRSYERSSSDCYEENRKNIKGRSRSRSFDRKEHIKYDRNKKESDFSKDYRRSYKSRSRSPSYHQKDKKESRHASKYRSRSKSNEYYDKKQKSSKKNSNRRSGSSSSDSSLSSKNKDSRCHRSNTPQKDKDKSTSSRRKDSSNSSDETKSFKSKHNYKDCSNKTKKSTYDLEKNRKYSESESETNYTSQKRDIDKSAKKYYKDKKSKSSKKYDNDSSSDDDERRSYSRKKKTYSSHYKSSNV